ncbi:hypothetical protein W02_25110 [Nitrospira sp. KM1]|uniref:YbgA family protein n=1 Tax=Nitrospira sp. KM1 TaxID=1936990 RepID=UPI0013A799A9|nr:DUF523 and DUF1722 domain-containing protein [Nitrospira sp. KM1]BCA55371.1 hypothetical protein W02_25110 [Nitrospira sp. KM1]
MTSTGLSESHPLPIRIGVSRCLLGEQVRYDGGHKRDRFVTDVLSRHVEWVPICPEVEAGMTTPREPMRLEGDVLHPELITIKTGRNMTRQLADYTERKLGSLAGDGLSGYIFKKDSPSCGVTRVRVFDRHGLPIRSGVGLFARAFTKQYPLVPVEDEGRLSDPAIRDNFIERVCSYYRFQRLGQGGLTREKIVRFHTIHKYLVLAHSRGHYQTLGRLVAHAHVYRSAQLYERYGPLFMQALSVKTTLRKHVNVLQHIVGHLKDRLQADERQELDAVIREYHQGFVPLVVPITLLQHYAGVYDVSYLREQVYLTPYPKELKLRNYV